MNEAGGFEAYAMYNALKLHFTGNYDYVKYSGKTSVSKDQFLLRKDKFQFYKLSRKYKREEMFGFLVANLLEKPKLWAGDLLSEDADSVYKVWMRTQQSLHYIFEQDLNYLFDLVDTPDMIIKVVDGEYPILYNAYLQGKVQQETIIIMNDIMGFMPMWTKKISDDIVFPGFTKQCAKYAPFINYDKAKFMATLRNKLCQFA
jgi:hypothetical protein